MRALGPTACLGLLLLAAAPVAAETGGDDPLYYEVEEGRLVFTNTPTATARPVPGSGPAPPAGKYADLPDTIYDPFIERVARENGLSPGLIKAVALVESGFDPHAVSAKGAGGLMQLMPGTARQYGVDDVFDPLQNLRAGATHLRHLLDEFDGNLTLALAAYNAGAGAVSTPRGRPGLSSETHEYLRRVKARHGSAVAPEIEGTGRRPMPMASPLTEDVKLLRQADGSVLLTN